MGLVCGLLAAAATAAPVAYVVEDYRIAAPLTATPGDAVRGEEIATTRALGNCLTCHVLPGDYEFPGTTGPTLVGVARRLDAGQLRLRLVDPKQINPYTMMPAYFRTTGLYRVAPEYVGKPILSAQQVEDVLAYLLTLR
ncbi:MAG: sulfur oxidation c-type cytochrome SoxX [Gammaproteobacteria bacterium]|nr:sulfur oxidation c-type cytochrome SoxX [Gammaproteobacteria bacterium]MCP5198968.1 sulfur oxidation c-type cytochrome SoxX [Gammaproteobacteria bacterium]